MKNMTTIKKTAEIKDIYSQLEKLGHEAAKEVRKYDQTSELTLSSAIADQKEGKVTQDWVEKTRSDIKRGREELIKAWDRKFDEFQVSAEATIDEVLAPASDELDTGALEVLKEFTLSPSEFERMAQGYEADGNLTMLRRLEAYRSEHNIDTAWRYQDGAKRKEALGMTIFGVAHNIDHKYHTNPEDGVTRTVSRGYRALQGADQKAFPVPEAEPEPSLGDRLSSEGRVVF